MRKENVWSRDFTLVVVGLFSLAMASYFFSSSIAVYADLISDSVAYISILSSAFYFGSLSMRLVNGKLVQKYGSHAMMIMGAVLCVVACISNVFAGSVFLLIILRVIHGAGHSIYSTAGGTASSYLVPPSRLSEGMGYYTIGNALAMAIGPSIALMIIAGNREEDFHALFISAAVICAVAFVLICFIRTSEKEKKNLRESRVANHKDLPKTFLGFEKGVLFPALVHFLMAFAYSPVIVYLAKHGIVKGWENVGFGFTIFAAGLLFSRLFVGRLGDRFGTDYVMLPAFICGALALSLIAIANKEWQIFVAMLFLGLCIGIFSPQVNVLCISRCTSARRGTANAAANGSNDLGMAMGSAVTGACIAKIGFTYTLLMGVVICLLSCCIYVFTLSAYSKQRKL